MVEAVVRAPPSQTQTALQQEAEENRRSGAVNSTLTAEQIAVQEAVLAERSSLLQEFGDLTQRVRLRHYTFVSLHRVPRKK